MALGTLTHVRAAVCGTGPRPDLQTLTLVQLSSPYGGWFTAIPRLALNTAKRRKGTSSLHHISPPNPFIEYQLLLRPGVRAHLTLPEDFTATEAKRGGAVRREPRIRRSIIHRRGAGRLVPRLRSSGNQGEARRWRY